MWTVRCFEPQDCARLNDLYNTVFRGSRTIERWKWKFLDSPAAGEGPPIVVAESDGQLIGAYPAITSLFKASGSIIRAAQPVDNAILPTFQGRGIQRAMWNLWIKEAARQGFSLCWGFPNPAAFRIGIRVLKYIPVAAASVMKFDLEQGVVRKLQRKLSHRVSRVCGLGALARTITSNGKKLKLRPLERFDERADLLLQESAGKSRFGVFRDHCYLNWRYFTMPQSAFTGFQLESEKELIGYIILRTKVENRNVIGYIYDLTSVCPEKYGDILLSAAIRFFLNRGACKVRSLTWPHDPAFPCLESWGFSEEDLQPFSLIIYPLSDIPDRDALKDIKNWNVCLGDTDL